MIVTILWHFRLHVQKRFEAECVVFAHTQLNLFMCEQEVVCKIDLSHMIKKKKSVEQLGLAVIMNVKLMLTFLSC